jgi:hypothetical protein
MRTLLRLLALILPAAITLVGSPLIAQQLFLPPNVILPNNESLPVGAQSGLEGNAFTARSDDSTAPWFNPSGLAAAPSSSAAISAGTFRFVTITSESENGSGSSINQVPVAAGFVLKNALANKEWTLGFSVTRTAAWKQESDFRVTQGTDLRDRTTLSADTEFNRTTLAFAAGRKNAGSWRFGGGLLFDILSLRDVESLTFRRETDTFVDTGIASNRATGSQATIRLGMGAETDFSQNVKFGVTLRTPGVRILPGATYTADAVHQQGAVSNQASFFDADTAEFKYKLPFEGAVGLAWVSDKFEVELDVKGQTGISAYSGFSSPQSIIFISDKGDGSPAQVTQGPFPGKTFESRAIVNASVGGHLNLDQRKIWALHAGFLTDRSPVGSADTFFDRIDLYAASIGVSGTAYHVAGSLGVTYVWGTSGERSVPDLVGGTLALTKVKISNFGIIYSFSYVF